MLKLHKVFHTFWIPDQIILNNVCSQFIIPEHFEVIDKLQNVEITQGFSYVFRIALNGFCAHWGIHENFKIIDTLENCNISLDQCNKTNTLKGMHYDKFEPTFPCQ